MKKQQLISGVVLAGLVALGFYAQYRYPINWHEVQTQFKSARWRDFATGLACIYLVYGFRSARWAMLLKHHKSIPPLSLLGTQVIGFTALALVGRAADPVRPYLISRKTGLSLSSQFAVYVVERLFDAGSMAVIFSIGMLGFSQAEVLRAAGHSGIVTFLGLHSPHLAVLFARFGGLLLTVLGTFFLIAIRHGGPAIAGFSARILSPFSRTLSLSVSEKIRSFHSGLDAVRTFGEFSVIGTLSILMWVLITLAYLITCRAFADSPELSGVTFSQCILLMIVSAVGGLIQLPVVGWFTQAGLIAISISSLFGASREASMACAASLLLVTYIGVIPLGLIWAQFENISLRRVTSDSELTQAAMK